MTRSSVYRLTAAIISLLVVSSGLLLGWFRAERTWQEATGWDQLTELQKRAAGAPSASASGPRSSVAATTSRLPATVRTTSRQRTQAPELEWLGHSGFLLRWAGSTLLIDPNTSRWSSIARRQLEPATELGALGRVDAVLVSHAHLDHLDLPTLRSLRGQLDRIVVPSGAERYFEASRWPGLVITPLEHSRALSVGDLEVVAVDAAHNGNRSHPFASRIEASGYIVRHADRALYFAGDTGRSNDFAAIRDGYHPDVAILPIGAFAPRFPLARYHLSPEEAVEVGLLLGVETVVPSHFGTFRLSLDRPETALPRFAREAERLGLTWQMPRLRGAWLGAGDGRESRHAALFPTQGPGQFSAHSIATSKHASEVSPRTSESSPSGAAR